LFSSVQNKNKNKNTFNAITPLLFKWRNETTVIVIVVTLYFKNEIFLKHLYESCNTSCNTNIIFVVLLLFWNYNQYSDLSIKILLFRSAYDEMSCNNKLLWNIAICKAISFSNW
jgi:hypothetical protein